MADDDQKTHDPTPRKLEDARAKGDVATAPEMRHAVMFGAAIIVVGGLGVPTIGGLSFLFLRLWGHADDYAMSPAGAQGLMAGVLRSVFLSLLPLLAVLVVCALLTMFSQGRPSLSWSRISPKWSKLSPVAGFGRLLGKRALVEFLKTLIKLGLVICIALMMVWPKAGAIVQLVGAEPAAVGRVAGELVFLMIKAAAMLVAALAAFDFVYQRFAFTKRMRMSLQEIKDEHKQSEGDPKIKAKIRAIGMQRARRRMMAAVPTANVIITNPTHYAIALKYEHGTMVAPIVVAKGADEVALRIREVATAANVPIVESPVLARTLYASVKIDQQISTEHYAAVAAIISYVMQLTKRR